MKAEELLRRMSYSMKSLTQSYDQDTRTWSHDAERTGRSLEWLSMCLADTDASQLAEEQAAEIKKLKAQLAAATKKGG